MKNPPPAEILTATAIDPSIIDNIVTKMRNTTRYTGINFRNAENTLKDCLQLVDGVLQGEIPTSRHSFSREVWGWYNYFTGSQSEQPTTKLPK